MKESIEFRIPEEHATGNLPEDIGSRLGTSVRKVRVDVNDPLFFEIGRLQKEFKARGKFFFSGREYFRRYSKRKLSAAELFSVWPNRIFEPAGEECGTKYDESIACPECGGGAVQISDLRLDIRKTPRSVDIAVSIAGEIVVSQRFAECMREAKLQGFELHRVRHHARHEDDPIDLCVLQTGREILKLAEAEGAPHPTWELWVWLNQADNKPLVDKAEKEYVAVKQVHEHRRRRKHLSPLYQLVVTSPPVELSALTRVGSDPFDEDSYGRCTRGDTAGLNLLSEVSILQASVADADVMVTRQMVGARRGLLRPRPILLFSRGACEVVQLSGLKGIRVEVAHLV